ncbi:DMT family transporter [Pacificibacter marinus]|uniref:DMT family transporter n=1 Tax=Pacificibacter marinus TaxID=658057 RepID=UPI001C07CAB0|nr:DMT family transporter [Pacificibacter marinus]MBU2868550.1 DMT family transporter [Pacificibacter marinus]
MGHWITSLEGTEFGHQLALILAISAAILHAFFGALQKGRHDPWLSRGAMDFCYGLIAAPFALFVVPWPEPHMWLIFAGMFVIHTGYKIAQGYTYSKGAYTVVYPVVRGTGPLFTVIGAGFVFGEHFSTQQWIGVGVLITGIFGLAVYNLRTISVGRDTMVPALMLAILTGGFVALYTTYDAYGIRATADPFTFLAWFFFLDGFVMPVVAAVRYRRMTDRPDLLPLMKRGLLGGIIAYFSFGFIMLATRLDNVGEAAVLRETSTVFAALIGWLVLKEKVGPRRLALMALIALGAVIVEMGG